MSKYLFVLLGLLIFIGSLAKKQKLRSMFDQLDPYSEVHGSKHSLRTIRSIQPYKFGNSTYETFTSHISKAIFPVTSTRYFVAPILQNTWQVNNAYGHYTVLRNPLQTFSVFEAASLGCQQNKTETVQYAAKRRGCVVAQNGGFFRTSSNACIGNVISNGHVIHSAGGIQNVNFGITKNGTLLTGYFSQEEIDKLNFKQLIAGVIWLVRNGSSFVEESIKLEEESSEETGTLRQFVDVISARTAIGHDSQGRIVFVHVDGQTRARGTNLESFAKFLITKLDVVNAINLDGGGSATLVLNGSLASYPSDHCVDDPKWRCPRSISTVICAHEPYCEPACQNGRCVAGMCDCFANWQGEACEILSCGVNNCSEHGVCTSAGCFCHPGWRGDRCQSSCQPGSYGVNCSKSCWCAEGSGCDSVSGHCRCNDGFMGKVCDQKCPVGKYGRDCQHYCQCNDTCFCDAKTGACLRANITTSDQPYWNVTQCIAERTRKKFIAEEDEIVTSTLRISYILGAVLFVSFSFNIMLLWKLYLRGQSSKVIEEGVNDRMTSAADGSDVTVTKQTPFTHFIQKLSLSTRPHYTRLNGDEEDFETDQL